MVGENTAQLILDLQVRADQAKREFNELLALGRQAESMGMSAGGKQDLGRGLADQVAAFRKAQSEIERIVQRTGSKAQFTETRNVGTADLRQLLGAGKNVNPDIGAVFKNLAGTKKAVDDYIKQQGVAAANLGRGVVGPQARFEVYRQRIRADAQSERLAGGRNAPEFLKSLLNLDVETKKFWSTMSGQRQASEAYKQATTEGTVANKLLNAEVRARASTERSYIEAVARDKATTARVGDKASITNLGGYEATEGLNQQQLRAKAASLRLQQRTGDTLSAAGDPSQVRERAASQYANTVLRTRVAREQVGSETYLRSLTDNTVTNRELGSTVRARAAAEKAYVDATTKDANTRSRLQDQVTAMRGGVPYEATGGLSDQQLRMEAAGARLRRRTQDTTDTASDPVRLQEQAQAQYAASVLRGRLSREQLGSDRYVQSLSDNTVTNRQLNSEVRSRAAAEKAYVESTAKDIVTRARLGQEATAVRFGDSFEATRALDDRSLRMRTAGLRLDQRTGDLTAAGKDPAEISRQAAASYAAANMRARVAEEQATSETYKRSLTDSTVANRQVTSEVRARAAVEQAYVEAAAKDAATRGRLGQETTALRFGDDFESTRALTDQQLRMRTAGLALQQRTGDTLTAAGDPAEIERRAAAQYAAVTLRTRVTQEQLKSEENLRSLSENTTANRQLTSEILTRVAAEQAYVEAAARDSGTRARLGDQTAAIRAGDTYESTQGLDDRALRARAAGLRLDQRTGATTAAADDPAQVERLAAAQYANTVLRTRVAAEQVGSDATVRAMAEGVTAQRELNAEVRARAATERAFIESAATDLATRTRVGQQAAAIGFGDSAESTAALSGDDLRRRVAGLRLQQRVGDVTAASGDDGQVQAKAAYQQAAAKLNARVSQENVTSESYIQSLTDSTVAQRLLASVVRARAAAEETTVEATAQDLATRARLQGEASAVRYGATPGEARGLSDQQLRLRMAEEGLKRRTADSRATAEDPEAIQNRAAARAAASVVSARTTEATLIGDNLEAERQKRDANRAVSDTLRAQHAGISEERIAASGAEAAGATGAYIAAQRRRGQVALTITDEEIRLAAQERAEWAKMNNAIKTREKQIVNEMIASGELGGTATQRTLARLSPGVRTPADVAPFGAGLAAKAFTTLSYAGSAVATGFLFSGISSAVKEASQLESTFVRLQGQMAALNRSGEFSGVRSEIKAISTTTGVAASDVAEFASRMLGVFRDKGTAFAMKQTESAMKLMVVTGIDLNTMMQSVIPTAKSFGVEVGDIGNIAVQTGELLGISEEQVVEFLGKSATVAKQAGLNMRETTILGATMAQNLGKDLGSSADVLNKMPELLQRNQDEIFTLLRKTPGGKGIPFIEAMQANLRDKKPGQALLTLLKGVREGAVSPGDIPELATKIGNAREVEDVTALLVNAISVIARLEDAQFGAAGATGAMESRFEQLRGTVANTFERVQKSIESFVETLFNLGISDIFQKIGQNAEVLIGIIGLLGKAITSVNDATKSFGVETGLIAPVLGFATQIGVLLGAVKLLASAKGKLFGVNKGVTESEIEESGSRKINSAAAVTEAEAVSAAGAAKTRAALEGATATEAAAATRTTATAEQLGAAGFARVNTRRSGARYQDLTTRRFASGANVDAALAAQGAAVTPYVASQLARQAEAKAVAAQVEANRALGARITGNNAIGTRVVAPPAPVLVSSTAADVARVRAAQPYPSLPPAGATSSLTQLRYEAYREGGIATATPGMVSSFSSSMRSTAPAIGRDIARELGVSSKNPALAFGNTAGQRFGQNVKASSNAIWGSMAYRANDAATILSAKVATPIENAATIAPRLRRAEIVSGAVTALNPAPLLRASKQVGANIAREFGTALKNLVPARGVVDPSSTGFGVGQWGSSAGRASLWSRSLSGGGQNWLTSRIPGLTNASAGANAAVTEAGMKPGVIGSGLVLPLAATALVSAIQVKSAIEENKAAVDNAQKSLAQQVNTADRKKLEAQLKDGPNWLEGVGLWFNRAPRPEATVRAGIAYQDAGGQISKMHGLEKMGLTEAFYKKVGESATARQGIEDIFNETDAEGRYSNVGAIKDYGLSLRAGPSGPLSAYSGQKARPVEVKQDQVAGVVRKAAEDINSDDPAKKQRAAKILQWAYGQGALDTPEFAELKAAAERGEFLTKFQQEVDDAGGGGEYAKRRFEKAKSDRDAGRRSLGSFITEAKAARVEQQGLIDAHTYNPEQEAAAREEVERQEVEIRQAEQDSLKKRLETAISIARLSGRDDIEQYSFKRMMDTLPKYDEQTQIELLPQYLDQAEKAFQERVDAITDPIARANARLGGFELPDELVNLQVEAQLYNDADESTGVEQAATWFGKNNDEMYKWAAAQIRGTNKKVVDVVNEAMAARRQGVLDAAAEEKDTGTLTGLFRSKDLELDADKLLEQQGKNILAFGGDSVQQLLGGAAGYFNTDLAGMSKLVAQRSAEWNLSTSETILRIFQERRQKMIDAGVGADDPGVQFLNGLIASAGTTDFGTTEDPATKSFQSRRATRAKDLGDITDNRKADIETAAFQVRGDNLAQKTSELEIAQLEYADALTLQREGLDDPAARKRAFLTVQKKLAETEDAKRAAALVDFDFQELEAHGDPEKEIAARLGKARTVLAQALADAGGNTEAESVKKALLDVRKLEADGVDSQLNVRRSEFSLLQAQGARDPLKVARIARDQAQFELNNAKGTADENEKAAALIRADQGIADAMSAIYESRANLAIALAEAAGDPVKAARIAMDEAKRKLDEAVSQGRGEAEVNQLKGAFATATENYYKTGRAREEQIIDFQLQMGQITTQTAIEQLRLILSRTREGTDEYMALAQKIRGLEQQAGTDLQFNLPSTLGLPTLYESRRVSQSTMAGIGYQDNRNIVLSVNVNGTQDPMAVANQIMSAFSSATGTGNMYAPLTSGVNY